MRKALSFILALVLLVGLMPMSSSVREMKFNLYQGKPDTTIAKQSALVITRQPTDGKAVLGEEYCVTVEAIGEDLKYEWYCRNAGDTQWFKSGVTDNTYDAVMTIERAGREVYCVITDAYGNSVTSNTVKLICMPTVATENWEQWIQPFTLTAATYPTYGGFTTGYYNKGQVFGGIAYSSTFREGTDVLWNLNPSTYYSAVANPASLLYTKDYRGRVANESSWAGCVCSTTVMKACGYDFPYSTTEIRKGFQEKTQHGIDNIEVGDILWKTGHVAGVVGVNTEANGKITSVKIIEQANFVTAFEVTAKEWEGYFSKHWKTIYRGNVDETLLTLEVYPENHSIIFERGNNTYVTDYNRMLFYIPTATTVYLTKNGITTHYAKDSFPSQKVNGVTVYDLASLFTGVGDYFFHTDVDTTDMCIKVIEKGSISISNNTLTLSGYSNCRPCAYRVIEILDSSTSSAYNFFDAPKGYTSQYIDLSFRKIDSDTFAIENIPQNAVGWKIEVFYDTGYGWARFLSDRNIKIDHDYADATCTKPQTCKVCGSTFGEPLGHAHTGTTCSKPQKCTICGETTIAVHNYEWKVDKKENCGVSGFKHKECTLCHKKINGKTIIPSTGKHKYTNNCDTACNNCGTTRTVAHKYRTAITKATANKDGSIVKRCTLCGKIENKTVIYRADKVKLSTTKYIYNAKLKMPVVTVYDSMGNKISSEHYDISCNLIDRRVGKYKVSVKLKGNYSGTLTAYFTKSKYK